MRKAKLVFIGTLLFLLTGGAALAMSSSSYQLPWQSVSAGGGDRSSSNYTLSDTVGQSSAVGVSQSANYSLEAGFWSGFVGSLPGDADGNGVVNVLDMTKVARIILLLDDETPGADANQDNVVNVLDMTKIARIILQLD